MASKRMMTLARVRGRMKLLARSISSLTTQELKKGRAVSYGTFADPGPNLVLGRIPAVFSGGN